MSCSFFCFYQLISNSSEVSNVQGSHSLTVINTEIRLSFGYDNQINFLLWTSGVSVKDFRPQQHDPSAI